MHAYTHHITRARRASRAAARSPAAAAAPTPAACPARRPRPRPSPRALAPTSAPGPPCASLQQSARGIGQQERWMGAHVREGCWAAREPGAMAAITRSSDTSSSHMSNEIPVTSLPFSRCNIMEKRTRVETDRASLRPGSQPQSPAVPAPPEPPPLPPAPPLAAATVSVHSEAQVSCSSQHGKQTDAGDARLVRARSRRSSAAAWR